MARFHYIAVDGHGVCCEADAEAVDESSLWQQLLSVGLVPRQIVPATTADDVPILLATVDAPAQEDAPAAAALSGNAASPVAAASFTKEESLGIASDLAALTKTGLPLEAGLEAMAEEASSAAVKASLQNVAAQLRSGQSLQAAIASVERQLPAYFVAMIGGGIDTGRVAQVVEQSVLLDRQADRIRRQIWLSVSYPLLVLVTALGVYSLLASVFVPGMKRVFLDFGTELPAITKLVLVAFSPQAVAIGWSLLGIAAVLGVMAFAVRRQIEWIDRALYVFPLLGPIWYFAGLARFSRVLGLMTQLAIPLPAALLLTASAVRSRCLDAVCKALASSVQSGTSLDAAIRECSFLPGLMGPFVAQGQATGCLPESLSELASVFDAYVDTRRTFFESIALPITLILVLLMTGVVVIGMFLPLIGIIQHLC
jgi:type IV pilus assembly protein PilC